MGNRDNVSLLHACHAEKWTLNTWHAKASWPICHCLKYSLSSVCLISLTAQQQWTKPSVSQSTSGKMWLGSPRPRGFADMIKAQALFKGIMYGKRKRDLPILFIWMPLGALSPPWSTYREKMPLMHYSGKHLMKVIHSVVVLLSKLAIVWSLLWMQFCYMKSGLTDTNTFP